MTLTCRIHGAKDLRLEDDGPATLGTTDVEMTLGAGISGSRTTKAPTRPCW